MDHHQNTLPPHQEGEEWKEGEFKECTCTPQGEIQCTCVEQNITCADGEEFYWDENCQKHCSRGFFFKPITW